MAIYIGGTELNSLFSGGTQIQKVYSGADEVWSNAETVMASNGVRDAESAVAYSLFANASQYIIEFDVVLPTIISNRKALMSGNTPDEITMSIDNDNLRLVSGTGRDFPVFTGMLAGDLVHVTITRPFSSSSVTVTADNGTINISDTQPMNTGAGDFNFVYSNAGTKEWLPSGAFFNFSCQDVTTGTLTEVPLNEGEGLESFIWIDGVKQLTNPLVWTPDVDWIDLP
jgi:hypothetical protein